MQIFLKPVGGRLGQANLLGFGQGYLFGYALPAAVAEDPGVDEALVAVDGGAIGALGGDVVEAAGDDGAGGNGVGDEHLHFEADHAGSFFLVAVNHGGAVAEAAVGIDDDEVVGNHFRELGPVTGLLDGEPLLLELGDGALGFGKAGGFAGLA